MSKGKDQLKKRVPFTFFSYRFYDWTKRLIDVFLALLVLIVGLSILVLIAALIKMESRGPVFFLQNRVGKKGKIFKMFKFRTMIINAESVLSKNPALFREYQQMGYKLKNDPRITSVGRFLRKYSLDELPQVINVLRGEMSVVGPRAYKRDELKAQLAKVNYSKRYLEKVLSVKPGLTGVWQISGRSEINFRERIYLDFTYANRRSILYDLLIVLKTIPAVLKGRGAW